MLKYRIALIDLRTVSVLQETRQILVIQYVVGILGLGMIAVQS